MFGSLFEKAQVYLARFLKADSVECSCGHRSPRAFKLDVPVRGRLITFDVLGPVLVGHLPYERALGREPVAVRPHLCADCLAEEVKTAPSVLISYRFKARVGSYHDLHTIHEWLRPITGAGTAPVIETTHAAESCGCEGCPV